MEVDDEVLIINPLIASLGTKAMAAAEGAVTTDDYMLRYVKQLVTLLLDSTIGLAQIVAWIGYYGDKLDSPSTGLTAILNTVTYYGNKLDDASTGLTAIINTIGAVDDKLVAADTGLAAIINTVGAVITDLGNETDGLHRLLAWIQYYGDKLDDPSTGLTAIINTLVYYGGKLDSPTTGLEAIINTVQYVAAYLASGTFGLGVLKALIETVDTVVDGVQTNLGAKADTPVVGFPGSNSALAILKGLQIGQGGFVYGDITGFTDTKNFASTTLAAFETGFFNGWTCFLAKDDAGAGATPQGARSVIDTFTTSTGAIVLKDALPAAGAVGDHIILVNPILLDAWNMRGGPRSLETLGEDQDAGLDVARGTSGAVSVDGGEDDVYNESNANEFVILELLADLNNMAEGDTIIFKVYTTEGGTERKISLDIPNTFSGVQDPARVEIIGSSNQVWGREGIRVCAVKTQGTTRTVTAFYRDAKRGS